VQLRKLLTFGTFEVAVIKLIDQALNHSSQRYLILCKPTSGQAWVGRIPSPSTIIIAGQKEKV
jgi:hypothetical protein